MNLNCYIAQQFANPSGFGGKIITAIMNQQNMPMYEATIAFLSPKINDEILDIGCGSGLVLNKLAKQYDIKLVGIDISPSILKIAMRRNKLFVAKGRLSFQHGDILALKFPAKSFDKIYSINVSYFWDDLAPNFKEIKRVLKAKGLFINTIYTNQTLKNFSHTQFGYRNDTVADLMAVGESQGFKVTVNSILNGKALCFVYQLK
ncbi:MULTISPECIES: class I SAM-dependent methyltransferase [unclassified Enterococcus]|uniref:class I SAM-dependent methyltransferase n=1 Tax=unclassified Enterococcus TaxID=2608891 RepID=UPI001557D10F|nr:MULTISPECIES: class I SAM-dependent methyltransferase [unclassified Enterococcus]MBS7576618.1 class I SAM-dependent methyltransferase [Enterococcus sp. MMGLQ5-2]MBS7583895.1 class I SAM-dependent methyltransferase [Enterococcus sp. MMGLQ5-1]NPD11756.1 class I SAM-dependent methyltransferase [Enterococcus sp. MMGLQ5-1]NPD36455.1 class I SAM-dependent methyltransferase [Enterococcus sp. MMGLQ5-2]